MDILVEISVGELNGVNRRILSCPLIASGVSSNTESLSDFTNFLPLYFLPALQTSPGLGIIIGVQDSQSSAVATIENACSTVGIGRFTVTTDKIPVGTILQLKTFTQIEFKLRTGLESGESMNIVPISDNVQQTTLVTNTVGAISDVFPMTFEKGQWLSFLIQGIGNSATSGVRLYEIRIR